jgi:hypothetical protein
MKAIGAAVVVLVLAGGCSNDRPRALLAENPGLGASIGAEAGAAAEAPIPGARHAALATTVAAHDKPIGPGVLNSDNRPIITRSGLNSDPNNPSGMPGRPSAPSGG